MFRLKVREVAESKGVSQRKLFMVSGVDITTIRKVFRNPQTVVTTETLTRLANVLEVDVSQLIESVPDEPGQPPRPAKRTRRPKAPKPAQPSEAAQVDEVARPDEPDKPDNAPAP